MFRKNEKGQITLLVLGVLSVVLLVTSSMVATGMNQRIKGNYQNKQMQAYYVADAGLVKALAMIKANPAVLQPGTIIPEQEYGEGKIKSVRVKISESDNSVYEITSEGQYPDSDQGSPSRKTLTAQIKVSTNDFGGLGNEGTIFSRGNRHEVLILVNDCTIESNIECSDSEKPVHHSFNLIDIHDLTIKGNIRTNGDVILGSGCEITGNIYSRGDVSLLNGNSVSNEVKALGDIKIGHNNQINGVVHTNKDISISGSNKFNKVYSQGNVNITNAQVQGEVKTYSNLTIGGNGKVNSSVWVMGNLTLNPSAPGYVIEGDAYVQKNYQYCLKKYASKVKGRIIYLEYMPPLRLTDADLPPVEPVPVPDLAAYKAKALQQGEGHYFSKGSDFNLPSALDGIYYVKGDININNNYSYSGRGVFVAEGNIHINKKILPVNKDTDSLLLIAQNKIFLHNDSEVEAYLWTGDNTLSWVFSTVGVKVTGGIISPKFFAASRNIFINKPANKIEIISWKT